MCLAIYQFNDIHIIHLSRIKSFYISGGIAIPTYYRGPLDMVFGFDTTNLAVGSSAKTGGDAAYLWEAFGQRSAQAFTLDNDSIMEIEGMEFIGPYSGTYRQKIKYAKLIIDGNDAAQKVFGSELMFPARFGNQPNPMEGMYEGSVCMNFGKGLIVGGDPTNATPKIGPGQTLEAEVAIPSTALGGEALSQPMRLRLHVIMVKGASKVNELLRKAGRMDTAGKIDQSFTIGDLENTEEMPEMSITKSIPESRAFTLADWTALYGGNDVAKPFVENYIRFGQNNKDTTPGEWFQFTQEGLNVNDANQVLKWTLDQYSALKVSHIGVLSHDNAKYLRLEKSGQAYMPTYRIDPNMNMLPMPQGIYTTDERMYGPAKLGRSYWIWNTSGQITVKDNNTAIPAWATKPTRGVQVGIWGKMFSLERSA